ncbi:MAG: hypothetical protein PHE68_04595 [Candidatus Peribacteraceae bacterium]|nr:hypothetical protein [Candidatus Peribacteraceae bacterium]MDD5074869.1 hypothetical protein [Candidatus Peribacteraceae bacterium]
MKYLRSRPGTTLVELILFLAFFALAGGMVTSMLFATSEHRVEQRTILTVERVGTQLIQVLTRHIQNAERVLDPPIHETGAILALRVANDSDNPTILLEQSGSLMIVRHETLQTIGGEGMVSHFSVRNVSATDDRPGILVSFDVLQEAPIPRETVRIFSRHFERLIPLFPDDHVSGDACGCEAPSCSQGTYRWEVCAGETCSPASITLPCS